MTLTINNIEINQAGTDVLIRWMSEQYTGVAAPLASGADASATSFAMDIGAWQPAVPRVAAVGTEIVRVTAGTGTPILTVTRGFAGTTAVAHGAGEVLRDLRYQSLAEGARALLVQMLRSLMDRDQVLMAPVAAAEATRKATIEAAVV